MAATLLIRDEMPGAPSFHEWSLDVLTERITVREWIRSRVYQEVQDFNQAQRSEYRGLVQPTDSERTLNGFRLKKPRQIDSFFQRSCAMSICSSVWRAWGTIRRGRMVGRRGDMSITGSDTRLASYRPRPRPAGSCWSGSSHG